jgi:hypothetical protein
MPSCGSALNPHVNKDDVVRKVISYKSGDFDSVMEQIGVRVEEKEEVI